MAKSPQGSDNVEAVEPAAVEASDQELRCHETILEHLFSYYRPRSVVDIGCGHGCWVKVCLAMGLESVHGYDVGDLPAGERMFPPEHFTLADLSQPVHFERKADLAISTEVAEHIENADAETFIDNLTRASDVVLFSAALPYQGGDGHVNENWVAYWFEMFSKRDYRCFDFFRIPFWNDPRIAYFYRQNIMLYVHKDRAQDFVDLGLQEERNPLSLVHPDLYLKAVNRALSPEAWRMEEDNRHYYHSVDVAQGTKIKGEQNYTYGREILGRDSLGRRVQSLRFERDRLLRSRSWRVTKPLRMLTSLLRKYGGG